MDQTLELEISATTPVMSNLGVQLKSLRVAQSSEVSTRPALTIKCGREHCKKELSQMLARKVMERGTNKTLKKVLVCPDCYNHYRTKPSTTTSASRKYLIYPFGCDTKPSSYRGYSILSIRQL